MLENDRGFTLLETVIACAMIGLMVLVLTQMQLFGTLQLRRNFQDGAAQRTVRMAQSWLVEDLLNATEIAAFGPGHVTMALELEGKGLRVEYQLEDGNLVRRVRDLGDNVLFIYTVAYRLALFDLPSYDAEAALLRYQLSATGYADKPLTLSGAVHLRRAVSSF